MTELPADVLSVVAFLQSTFADEILKHHAARTQSNAKEARSLAQMEGHAWHLAIGADDRRYKLRARGLGVLRSPHGATPIFVAELSGRALFLHGHSILSVKQETEARARRGVCEFDGGIGKTRIGQAR